MRKLLPLAVVLLLTASGTAAVSYEIGVEGETAQVNVSFDLYSDRQVNYFTTNWRVGTDAEIINVRDGRGEIEEVQEQDEDSTGTYVREGDTLNLRTNTGDGRQSSSVEIQYRRPVDVQTWHDDLHVLSMQLSGFPDRFEEFDEEQTYVQVTVEDDIIGLSESFGFQSSYDGRRGTFSGEGPVNIKATYTDREGEYENFIRFGDANLTAADDVFPLARLVTGRSVEYRKLPVIVLDTEAYNEHLDSWSAGRYRQGGLIYIRENRIEEDDFTGLVMHEVMHAFNEEPLKWVETDASLFDEGTAKYVEFLVNENMDIRQAEIFGEQVTWNAPCSDGSGECRYSLEPRGTPDDLWSYHQQDEDFMQGWSASDEGTIREGLTLRTFGYAYSELLIRDLIRQEGPLYLHEVYDELGDIEEPAETTEGYTSTLGAALGTDLRPCDTLARNAMERCLDSVHEYRPDIPETVEVEGQRSNITFHKVEVPDAAARSENGNTNLTIEEGQQRLERSVGFVQGMIRFLADEATNLINAISQLLR